MHVLMMQHDGLGDYNTKTRRVCYDHGMEESNMGHPQRTRQDIVRKYLGKSYKLPGVSLCRCSVMNRVMRLRSSSRHTSSVGSLARFRHCLASSTGDTASSLAAALAFFVGLWTDRLWLALGVTAAAAAAAAANHSRSPRSLVLLLALAVMSELA